MEKADFGGLVRETKEQLRQYPRTTRKQDIKYRIKRLVRKKHTPKRDFFFWPQALLAQALEEAEEIEALKAYFDRWLKRGMPVQNIDNVMNGYSLLYVYQQTKEEKYKAAADKLYQYLEEYRKEMQGNFPYRKGNPTHVYADGIGMIVPFLCRYGRMFRKPDAVAWGMELLQDFLKFGMDADSGLPYHGYDTLTKVKQGIVGWGRAVGWLLLALADSYEYIEKEQKESVKKAYAELLNAVLRYQREDGSFSWALTAKEGPKDTSATAMIAYAMQKAIRMDVYEDHAAVEKLEKAILDSVNNGRIADCSGECLGFSQYPQVYGVYPWSQGPGTRFLVLRYRMMKEAGK